MTDKLESIRYRPGLTRSGMVPAYTETKEGRSLPTPRAHLLGITQRYSASKGVILLWDDVMCFVREAALVCPAMREDMRAILAECEATDAEKAKVTP